MFEKRNVWQEGGREGSVMQKGRKERCKARGRNDKKVEGKEGNAER